MTCQANRKLQAQLEHRIKYDMSSKQEIASTIRGTALNMTCQANRKLQAQLEAQH